MAAGFCATFHVPCPHSGGSTRCLAGGARSPRQRSAAVASEQMRPRCCGVAVMLWHRNVTQQHDIVLAQSLEATVASFENLWKSEFILGPLHPSGMASKMCNGLICLKTGKETCFRLFCYPALMHTLSTESQNHRMVGVGRDLSGSSGTTPRVEAGSPTAGCTGPCPGGSGISL